MKKVTLRKNEGITLVALVITIIVLLILAGVTINLTIGQDGIITKAKNAGTKMKIASIQEKLELEKTYILFETNDDTLNLEKYINRLIENEIITSDNVENTEYDNSKLITTEGFVFLITEENEDIKIEYQGETGEVIIVDRTKPVVTIKASSADTITIEATDNSSGIIGYTTTKTEAEPTTFIECENTLKLNVTINNLDENTKYYVWVKDAVGNISECKVATTSIANYSLKSGVKYETLEQAIENATNGDVIKVISDYTDTSDVTINKNLKLDTNGKTLTRTKTINISNETTVEITGTGILTTADKINLITNSGTLNITHEGTISNTNTENARVIYNTGKVNKTGSGTISHMGTSASIAYGEISISNGTINTTNSNGIYTTTSLNITNNPTITGGGYGIYLDGNATCNISGGNINGLKNSAICLGQQSSLTMTAGTLIGKTSGIYKNSTGNLEIKGGELTGQTYYAINCDTTSKGNVTITNGTFSGVNNGLCLKGATNCSIYGGTITASKYDGIYTGDSSILTITNGNIIGTNNAIYHQSSGKIKIDGGTLVGNGVEGILITSSGTGNVEITNGSITGNSHAVWKVSGCELTISGGTLTGKVYEALGCGAGENGITTINGGVLVGECNGIYMDPKSTGVLNINNGTITGNQRMGIILWGNETLNVTNATIKGVTAGLQFAENSSPTVNISGGKFEGTQYFGMQTYHCSGEVTIAGGIFTGGDMGLLVDEATTTVNITGGTFNGGTYHGISVTGNATVNIGDSTKTVNNDSISATGGEYGVYLSDESTVNYYSGTLKGKLNGYLGNIKIRTGYTVNTTTNGEWKVTTLK